MVDQESGVAATDLAIVAVAGEGIEALQVAAHPVAHLVEDRVVAVRHLAALEVESIILDRQAGGPSLTTL